MKKKIQVNNGFIFFDFSESGAEQLSNFAQLLDTVASELEDEKMNVEQVRKTLAKRFNEIFGRNACKKTFGESIPTMAQFEEFMDKFASLIGKWCKEMS